MENQESTKTIYHNSSNFLDVDNEQYLAIIVNCKGKKIDPEIEPLYHELVKIYPKANIYEGDKAILDRKPGHIKIIKNSLDKPDIILIYGQFYPGTADRPNDRKKLRLSWFQDALDEIAETKGLASIGFPSQICRDGGGSWSQYYLAIKDFSQTIHLKNDKIKVTIYENPLIMEEELEKSRVAEKIRLTNCLNVIECVDLMDLKSNTKKIIFQPQKPSLNDKESVSQGVNRTRIRLKQKEEIEKKKTLQALDLISSESAGSQMGDNISSDDFLDKMEDNEKKHKVEKERITLDLDSDHENESNSDNTPISVKPKIHVKTKSPKKKNLSKPKINLKKNNTPTSNDSLDSECEPFFPITKMNPDWNSNTLSYYAQTKLGGWSEEIFSLPEMVEIMGDVDRDLKEDLEENGEKARYLPEFDKIFRAFELSKWEETKVVILGQDPYFSNLNEAMGLSFSVPDGVKIPPSLMNIYKEIKDTYDDYEIPKTGNLESWARQGVLLLNSSLTVRHKEKECHMRIWKTLTDKIIQLISKKKEKPVVFMLWGNHAKGKAKLIDTHKHIILKATHPSPLGANRGGWFGCGHFGTSNLKLIESGQDHIDWGATNK